MGFGLGFGLPANATRSRSTHSLCLWPQKAATETPAPAGKQKAKPTMVTMRKVRSTLRVLK